LLYFRFHANLLRYKPVFLGERPYNSKQTPSNSTSSTKPVDDTKSITKTNSLKSCTSVQQTTTKSKQISQSPKGISSTTTKQTSGISVQQNTSFYSQQQRLSDHLYSSNRSAPTTTQTSSNTSQTGSRATSDSITTNSSTTPTPSVAANSNNNSTSTATTYDEYFSDISFSSAESEIFSDVSLLDPVPSFLDSMLATPTQTHAPTMSSCSNQSPEYDAYSSPSEASFEMGVSMAGGSTKHHNSSIYSNYSPIPPSRISSPPLMTSRGPLLTSTSIIFKETSSNKLNTAGFAATANMSSPFGGGHLAMTSPDAMEGIENSCFGGFFDSFHHNTSMPMFSK
jgi:hypothetical protein